MATPRPIAPFPKEHVWIPAKDGHFAHRPVTNKDKVRRGMVLQLLSPHYTIEEKDQIREDLEQMSWPCHEGHEGDKDVT